MADVKAEDRSPHEGEDRSDESNADDEEENVRPPWPPVICAAFHSTIVCVPTLMRESVENRREAVPKKLRDRQQVEKGRGRRWSGLAAQSGVLPSIEFSSIAPVFASTPTSCFTFWLLITNE